MRSSDLTVVQQCTQVALGSLQDAKVTLRAVLLLPICALRCRPLKPERRLASLGTSTTRVRRPSFGPTSQCGVGTREKPRASLGHVINAA